ncbi:MAG: hypothetical protein RL354_797 [Planctomycetota bacterium]
MWPHGAREDLLRQCVEAPAHCVPRAGEGREDRVCRGRVVRRGNRHCAWDAGDRGAIVAGRDVAVAVLGARSNHDKWPVARVIAGAGCVDGEIGVVCTAEAVEKGGHRAHRALSLWPWHRFPEPARSLDRGRSEMRFQGVCRAGGADTCPGLAFPPRRRTVLVGRCDRSSLDRDVCMHARARPRASTWRRRVHATRSPRSGRDARHVVGCMAVVHGSVHGALFGACSGWAADFVR